MPGMLPGEGKLQQVPQWPPVILAHITPAPDGHFHRDPLPHSSEVNSSQSQPNRELWFLLPVVRSVMGIRHTSCQGGQGKSAGGCWEMLPQVVTRNSQGLSCVALYTDYCIILGSCGESADWSRSQGLGERKEER